MPSLPTAVARPLLAAAVVLVSLAAATQWTAALLDYHPALGAPWLDLLGLKLYAPGQVFSWWLAFGAQAPGVFARTGTLAALGGVMAGLIASGGAARRAGHGATPSTTYGSARWARSPDVRDAGLFSGKGIVLGVRDGRYLRHDGPEHVLAVAPTRSGKGVGLVVPTLLTWPGSAVIHDIKGENWQLTAGWRSRFSHCLLLDPTSPVSARFNPLLEVRKGFHEVRDVHNIADILIDPEGARPGATTGRRARIPCSPAPSCTCSTRRRRRRSPASPARSPPASTRSWRCARASTRCAMCTTSPPSSPIPPAPSAGPCG
jgi:type IV secretion system protein VirD4